MLEIELFLGAPAHYSNYLDCCCLATVVQPNLVQSCDAQRRGFGDTDSLRFLRRVLREPKFFARVRKILSAAGDGAAAMLTRAIIDSGASHTYVTDDVQLEGATKLDDIVSCAGGQKMRVSEKGRLGPLAARKVKGFNRTLVSVAGLVDLPRVEKVVFSAGGVHLHCRDRTDPIHIGDRLSNNLFSFSGLDAVTNL